MLEKCKLIYICAYISYLAQDDNYKVQPVKNETS